MRTRFSFLEPLEPRIAPASVTVSYADLDGDLVKIKASNALTTAPPLDATDLTFLGGGASGQLAVLHLTDAGFDGASIVFTVVKKPGGNGLADVGRIDATGVDLGSVAVKGDLAVIDAGTGSGEALKSLQVRSMGLHGTASQGGGDLESDLSGSIGSVTVSADVKDAFIKISGGAGALTIRGSLLGGSVANGGLISATGDLGAVKIGGDMIGGSANNTGGVAVGGSIASISVRGSVMGGSSSFFNSLPGGTFHEGQIFAVANIGPVKIGRDIFGGEGFGGGEIRADGDLASIVIGGSLVGQLSGAGAHITSEGNMGPVKIGRDLIGGSSVFAGSIESFGSVGNVTIGGNLVGGSASVTGVIFARGDAGLIKIGGDIVGGSISGTQASLSSTGQISIGGRIAGLTVGGSIIAGIDSSTGGALSASGSISAGNDIGFIDVKGSLIGNVTANGDTTMVLSARGQATPSATSDLAIGKITIGGRVEKAAILAGYNSGGTGTNGNAQIGSVTVGGDWRASSLVAGVKDVAADSFGNADDVVIPSPAADGIFSRIASVTIKGLITGTATAGDHYGFTAQQIGAFKVGGVKLSLTEATDAPFNLALITNDVTLREV